MNKEKVNNQKYLQWKVQLYIGHKPDGAHFFETKALAYEFYIDSCVALGKSTIGGRVDLPVEVWAFPPASQVLHHG